VVLHKGVGVRSTPSTSTAYPLYQNNELLILLCAAATLHSAALSRANQRSGNKPLAHIKNTITTPHFGAGGSIGLYM